MGFHLDQHLDGKHVVQLYLDGFDLLVVDWNGVVVVDVVLYELVVDVELVDFEKVVMIEQLEMKIDRLVAEMVGCILDHSSRCN